jgi:hypothetical protein
MFSNVFSFPVVYTREKKQKAAEKHNLAGINEYTLFNPV